MGNDYYEITSPPSEEPVTLAEAKSWCKVETTEDDTLITALVKAARLTGEKYCNRTFVTTTFKGFYSALELTNCEKYPFVALRRAPLDTVTSVQLMVDDSLEDVDSDDYFLKEKSSFSRILFSGSLNGDDVAYPLEIVFTAGYGAASAVPEDIKTAIKQHILYLYENRGDVSPDGELPMPIEVRAMYSKYRILDTF